MEAPKERKFVAQRQQQGIDRSKAAKLFINTYYKNLVEQADYRQERLEKLKEETVGLSASEQEFHQAALAFDESQHMRLQRTKLSVKDFEDIKLIGRGAFGEVRIVRSKLDTTNRIYAMKIINKDFMIQKNQLAHARAERDAMVEFENNWVVKLYFSFQDSYFLYFVMEYLPGGDMMNLLINKSTLTEDEARFYFMELILAIDSVHAHDYIHRDLKPDNILIDARGHIKLSDFGLCTSGNESHLSSFYQTVVPKEFDEEYDKNKLQVIGLAQERTKMEKQKSWDKKRKALSYSTVGTSNYMAPEILIQKGYTNAVDWWSFGVIAYECLVGYAPFSCEDTADTCMLILNHKESLEFPPYEEVQMSEGVLDLITNLICDAEDRFTVNQLKSHYWFKGHDWDNIQNKTAPWIPQLSSEIDTKNFDELEDTSSIFTASKGYDQKPLKDIGKEQLPFVGWTFKRFEKKTKPSADAVFQRTSINNQDRPTRSSEDSTENRRPVKVAPEVDMRNPQYETFKFKGDVKEEKPKKDRSEKAKDRVEKRSSLESKIGISVSDPENSTKSKKESKSGDVTSSSVSGSSNRPKRHSNQKSNSDREKFRVDKK